MTRETARAYRLTLAAAGDIRTILRTTRTHFGTHQRRAYADLIDRAATLAATATDLAGSRDREEFGAGVRSFHLDNAAGRRGAAAHVLYFRQILTRDGSRVTIILRVLHHSMEPALHLG